MYAEIDVEVRRRGVKSVTYDFSFARDGEELATGRMTSVCCELGPDGVRAIPIPESIADALGEDGAGHARR